MQPQVRKASVQAWAQASVQAQGPASVRAQGPASGRVQVQARVRVPPRVWPMPPRLLPRPVLPLLLLLSLPRVRHRVLS